MRVILISMMFSLVYLLVSGTRALASDEFCGQISIESSNFNLNDLTNNERKLICGSNTPGWREIPINQAQHNIEIALRQRGFYQATIEEHSKGLRIVTGVVTKIKKVNFLNAPPRFFDMTFIGVNDNILNSESLDKIKKWSSTRLRSIGYPCPEVEVTATPNDGVVQVALRPGELESIGQVIRKTGDEINSSAISRFDAFEIGSSYNGDLFQLTSRRLMRSGLADYSDFHSYCGSEARSPNQFDQELTLGAPRKFVLSLGGTTEEYPIVKVRWEHSRLGRQASSLLSEVYLSQVRQSLLSEMNWYPAKSWPRFYIQPEVAITRSSESFYEALSQSLSSGIGVNLDDNYHRYRFEFRPRYNVENTFRGPGPEHTSYFSFESEIDLISHLYEFYETSPRAGYRLGAKWSTRRQGLGSSQNGDRYELSGAFLSNWGGFDPPIMVLGVRFKMQALRASRPEDSPTSLRLFLGGDDDLRGFPRKSLNNKGLGFSALYYVGTELRFVRVLPYELQPFLLADVAQVARQDYDFLPTLLWSPGVGMRWQSPIGSMRLTAAYGSVENENQLSTEAVEQWKFFFSFGKEF